MQELHAYLHALDGYPQGDARAWQARYRPLVAEVIDHRRRPFEALPTLTMVVVAWRSADFVLECLDHVRAQSGIDAEAIEVILVNNGGLDRAHDGFKTRVDTELRMAFNVGLSPARNAGVAWAAAPIVAFIDDDGLIAQDYAKRGLAYFKNDAKVAAIRTKIRKEHNIATTVGYGPRFLHSTGQLHKGDAGNGLFIQIVSGTDNDIAIPDEAGESASGMTFNVLKNAQALGDAQALLDNNRRLIRYDVGTDVAAGLHKLIS